MFNEMASELDVLAWDAARIARENPRTADFTRNILQRALKEIVACFPVYRTYIDSVAEPTEADRRDIDWAVAQARPNEADVNPSVFDFLHRLLTTDLVAGPHSGLSRQSVVRFAMRVQQYSGPVMAKGLEDTAFYRYNCFIALNEVGGHPDHFGVTLAAFHRANAQRADRWPHAMLTLPLTTPSAVKISERGSRCCRRSRKNGLGKSWRGAASCAPAAVTWRVRRHPIAMTNTCSTSFCSAPSPPS
jgi:(1->4)-alpha-D-glucan 1-alpha-D-glucosylmutase